MPRRKGPLNIRPLFVCENGHILRSIRKVKRARICPDCNQLVADDRICIEGMREARTKSEAILSLMTPGQLAKFGFVTRSQVYTEGRLKWRRNQRPRLLNFTSEETGLSLFLEKTG